MGSHFISDENMSLVKRVQDNIPVIIGVNTLLWLFSYTAVRRLIPKQSAEFCVRLVTLFHGLTTAYFGISECRTSHIFEGDMPMTNNQALYLTFTASYFVFDFIWSIFHQTETRLMLFHHLYSSIALIRIVSEGYSGTKSVCAVGITEVTNPLLQLRWYLRAADLQDSIIFSFVELTFFGVFIAARILFGSVFILVVLFDSSNNIEYKILSTIIYVVSWLFLLNMIGYIKNKYVQSNAPEQDFIHSPAS